MRDPGELAHLDPAREADHAVVGRMHAQQQTGLGSERALVVGRARAIRRADLVQARARALHDLRDPEAIADLHQLPARDDDLPPARQRRERQDERSGAVVDADRGLGAGQLADQRRHMILPGAAAARGEVELEVGIARGYCLQVLERRLGERRPAEVGVEDDTRGVEDRSQGGLERRAHAAPHFGGERGGGGLLSAGAALGQCRPRFAHAERVRRITRRLAHEDVDRRQRAGHRRIVRLSPSAATGGGCSSRRYTPSGRGPRSGRVRRRRPGQANTRERVLERRQCDENTGGDAALRPAAPCPRAPSAGTARARHRARADRDSVRSLAAAARLRGPRRARRGRAAWRSVAGAGRRKRSPPRSAMRFSAR